MLFGYLVNPIKECNKLSFIFDVYMEFVLSLDNREGGRSWFSPMPIYPTQNYLNEYSVSCLKNEMPAKLK